jgi:hypothetical protein
VGGWAPFEGNELVLIPMYANTSRRPPPSRPFLNLLCSLRTCLCAASCERLLDRPPLLSAHFLTPAANTVKPRVTDISLASQSGDIRSVAGGSCDSSYPDRTSYGAPKGSVAPVRRVRSGRALTAGSILVVARAVSNAALRSLSGPPHHARGQWRPEGRRPTKGPLVPAPVSLTSHRRVRSLHSALNTAGPR